MKNLIKLAGVISIFISINGLIAATVNIEGDGAPSAVVFKMHADWCPSCKALEPTLAELKAELKGEPVLFITLDITDSANTEQSRLLAEALGIESIMKKNNKTGLTLVYDPKTMETKHVFTKSDGMETMKAGIMGMPKS